MIIRFTKSKNKSKQDTLTCVREDGSSTWWPLSPFFAEHDMLHYIVETTLGFKEAFFGLIAQGRDIASFGTRDGKKDTYTREEGQTELLVGLLQVEICSGTTRSNAEFFAMLDLTCKNHGWPMPQQFSEQQLDSIRDKMREFDERWRKLPARESMELVFPI